MKFIHSLLFIIFLISTISTHDSWILPRSTSFHHALEYLHTRLKIPNPSSSFSFNISSFIPFAINGTNCHHDLSLLMNGFLNKELWALKILDSWGGKPLAGILEGSHLWLGSYDECLHSLYLPKNQSYVKQPYLTKYCTISNRNDNDDIELAFQDPSLIIGICLPQSCHSNDFQTKFTIRCRSDERYVSIGFIFTLSLIIILCLFVSIATFIPYLNEYSAIVTVKRIFSLTRNSSTYSFLNGIRSLSLFWIILGHSYVFQLTVSDNIVHIIENLHNSYQTQLLLGAIFGVDTFFFISGFLAVFIFINKFKTEDSFHFRHLIYYYLHRYCRLIPMLIFVLLVSMHLTSWMGDGPIFPVSNGFEISACHYQWWKTILFLNNVLSPTQSCLPVTWYIANDFQFHLLAPILLIPFILNRRRLTYVLLFSVLLINIITTLSIISTHPGLEKGISVDPISAGDYFEKIYFTPWCRIGAFIIGMMTKLFIEQYHSTLSLFKKIFYTIISISLAMICIYFPFYATNFPKFMHIIYQSLSHQCWSISIGWLIFLCSTNQGGLVNKILSWPFWLIIARLSYSAYLIHTIIIFVQVYNRLSIMHYQSSIIFNSFISQTILTLLASIFTVVIIEMPCQIFEKQIRKYYKDKQQIRINRQNYGTLS